MSRIEISAGGREVIVEHDSSLDELQRVATELWDKTAGVPDRPGPGSAGFSMERRPTAPVDPSSMAYPPVQTR